MARRRDSEPVETTSSNSGPDMLNRLTSAGNSAVDVIDRLDVATGKFQPGKRRGSIIKAAQKNVFEFPAFFSNTIPIDYAEATTTLLEQMYAEYLQMAISINPVVDASRIKNGLQFADWQTDTNKYLEYVDTSYQRAFCGATYMEGDYQTSFELLAITDHEARLINEAVDHQPLSEFDHFFTEAEVTHADLAYRYPVPAVIMGTDNRYHPVIDRDRNTGQALHYQINPNEEWLTPDELERRLINDYRMDRREAQQVAGLVGATLNWYGIPAGRTSTALLDNQTAQSDDRQIREVPRTVGQLTPQQYRQNQQLQDLIDDLDSRHPGFKDQMDAFNARAAEIRAAQDTKRNAEIGDTIGANNEPITYAQHIGNQRRDVEAQMRTHERQAQRADSRYYRANDAITTGLGTADTAAKTVNDITNAVGNIATFKDRLEASKLQNQEARLKNQEAQLRNEKAQKDLDTYDDRLKMDRQNMITKLSQVQKSPEYVNDAFCQKSNTLKPLLMKVTVNMLNKDDTLQPINYVVGVKVHSRVVPAEVLPEVAQYPLKEMDKLSRKVKWRAGELKFFKDLVFRIKEKKQTAVDSKDPTRKWYRRLYELAHMKGDAPSAAVVQGKSVFAAFINERRGKGKLEHGMIPNASIIISQADVDNVKAKTGINLLKGSTARNFCNELFLISFVIIDTDARSIKLMMPDIHRDFEVHDIGTLEKQIANLSTAGSRTKEIFKMLG